MLTEQFADKSTPLVPGLPREFRGTDHTDISSAMDGQTTSNSDSRGAGAPWGGRMRDFLTDGSVAALCDELARLMAVPVWLRDQEGEAIIPVWSEEGGGGNAHAAMGHPWSFVKEPIARTRAFEQVKLADDGSHETLAVPLRISMGVLGAIVTCLPRGMMSARADSTDAMRLQSIRRALLLLASSVCDVCEAQVALKKRVRELDTLYRLSSLLTAEGDAEELLHEALDLAMQALRVDAGTIAVYEEAGTQGNGQSEVQSVGERLPVVRAARGVSPEWLADTGALSAGGELRRRALAGEIIGVEDLTTDPRITDHERAVHEGLRAMLSTGLIDRGTPVGVIRLFARSPRVFTEQEGELLRVIGEHLASGITTSRLRRLRTEDERIQRQVRLAADVQRRLLPRSLPHMKPFDIAAHYAPSFELGGDFYDFIELGGHLGILIGDVVGKGVAAALLMSSVRSAIRAHAQDLYHIDEVLSRTNKALAEDTLDNEFATVWYGVVDPQSLRLTYCGAGHDWPLLVRMPRDRRVEDKDVQRLTADGMALGIDPAQKYPKGMFQLEHGDVLVAYTDGLHDATNFDGKRFGGTRLRKSLVDLLAAEPRASASRIVDYVIAQVRQHTGLNRRIDDITVVVMRVG